MKVKPRGSAPELAAVEQIRASRAEAARLAGHQNGGSYVYLRAWGRMYGVAYEELAGRLAEARESWAPPDALFRVGERWYRLRDLESRYVVAALNALVNVIRFEEQDWPESSQTR